MSKLNTKIIKFNSLNRILIFILFFLTSSIMPIYLADDLVEGVAYENAKPD